MVAHRGDEADPVRRAGHPLAATGDRSTCLHRRPGSQGDTMPREGAFMSGCSPSMPLRNPLATARRRPSPHAAREVAIFTTINVPPTGTSPHLEHHAAGMMPMFDVVR
jgi:hypothetical protein